MKNLIPSPPLTHVVHIRLTEEDRQSLENVSGAIGVHPAKFVRYALKKALIQEEKKLIAA